MTGAVKLNTAGGGSVLVQPASSIASDVTVNVPSVNCTLYGNAGTTITSGTAVASTSGTSIDFTGIPSWVKRITVMFSGVSTNGSSTPLLQVGSGSVTTSGYLGSAAGFANSIVSANVTTGFGLGGVAGTTWAATVVSSGSVVLTNVTGNTFVCSGVFGRSDIGGGYLVGGIVTLSGVLDRVRITTVNGTETFDAGTINILYE